MTLTLSNIAIDFNSPASIPKGFNGLPLKWVAKPEDQLASMVKGLWLFNPKEIIPYVSGKQRGALIAGTELKNCLEGQPLAGSQLLDFFLANQELIPKEWVGKRTIFWTIYRDSRDDQLLRYLIYFGGWTWESCSIENKFGSKDQSLLIKS